MSKKKLRNRQHTYTDMVHEEVAAQTPIIPQRSENMESGRQRVLEPRERVGHRSEREFHTAQFPPEK